MLYYSVLLPFFLLPSLVGGEQLFLHCGGTGNYTADSTYEANLKSLLTTLSSNASDSGFTNATVGSRFDQAYGLVLCRGDVSPTDCADCLNGAVFNATHLCPYVKGADIWYDNCLLAYSNRYFLSSYDNSPSFTMKNHKNASDVGRLDKLVRELLSNAAEYAAFNSTDSFATGVIGYFSADYPTIFGLVQCTPDMAGQPCRDCLQGLFDEIEEQKMTWVLGARDVGVRCNFRFEVYPFFQGAPIVDLTAANSSTPSVVGPAVGLSGKKISLALALVIALSLGVTTMLITSFCFWRRKPVAKLKPHETKSDNVATAETFVFDPSTIQVATGFFSEQNKIGEGGCGAVYKGLLPDGSLIAVKKLLTNSNHGLGELKNELVLASKLQHRNLVRLLGVCFEEEKFIVYEYVTNGSLDKFLFDPIRGKKLQWRTRHKIICGIARGLQYLHEESQLKIVHRDLKSSNILLDNEMNPKISDFGLAKLLEIDQTRDKTSRIVGTIGYMAPEYAMHGHFSTKSDIFCFGLLVLEIVAGKKSNKTFNSNQSQDLINHTWMKLSSGTVLDILDPVLRENYKENEVLRCIHVALLCVKDDPHARPNMSDVIVMLSSNTVSLQSPSEPINIRLRTTAELASESESKGSNGESLVKVIPISNNDLSITELEPR